MTIIAYQWAMEVVLTKMVLRQDGVAARYTRAQRTIDLTPYLGDGGNVSTTKTLRGQPSGAFQISFGDQADPDAGDTLYALIEPMDMLEIRASRTPHLYAGAKLPLIMRGFVSAVRRSESLGSDGSPSRVVTVAGHDFGKLWEIHQVWQELAITTEQPVLTVFGLQARLGITVAVLNIEDFMQSFVTKVMNPKVTDMAYYSSQVVKPFVAECSVKEGRLIPNVISVMESGSYWAIVSAVADAPWNELFIRDEEDGPHFVFRPAPFRGIDGKLILQDAADPGMVIIPAEEVVSWDVGRSDGRVANFFWVPPGSSSLDTNQYVVAGSLVTGSGLDFNYGNNAPQLYGEKKMEVSSALIADDSAGQTADMPAGQRPAENNRRVQWYQHRAAQLQAMNRDNSVLEDGTAAVMGREQHVIGQYLRLLRGDTTADVYVTAVTHSFSPLSSWQTTLAIERGTGFLTRNREESSSYYGEGRKGPYST